MSVLLQFEDVSFAFERRAILDHVSFSICEGDCVALIGPNGAGKTTLLRLAAGLLSSEKGKIFLKGNRLDKTHRREIARAVALVPQQMEVAFPFTVEQMIEQGRTPYLNFFGGLKGSDREAVERAMKLANVVSLRHRIFNELSGGERQRVKIALALAQNPKLLLLDEPTQNLDIGRQAELLDLIRTLRSEGVTIFSAIHELTLIRSTFSSVMLLSPYERFRHELPEEVLQARILERAFQCPPQEHSLFESQPYMELVR